MPVLLQTIPELDTYLQYGIAGLMALMLLGGYLLGREIIGILRQFMGNHMEHLTEAIHGVREEMGGVKVELTKVGDRLGFLVGVEHQKGEEYKDIKGKENGGGGTN